MDLTRKNIKQYLDDGFAATEYSKKIKGVSKLIALKDMAIDDLDFINILRNLFENIKNNYSSFMSNAQWKPSDRQNHLLEVIGNICDDILYDDKTKTSKPNLYLSFFEDLYWQVYDYFDDYGNKNDSLYKEEVDLVLKKLEKFFETYAS